MVKRTFRGMKLWWGAPALLLALPLACTHTDPTSGAGGAGGGGGNSNSSSSSSSGGGAGSTSSSASASSSESASATSSSSGGVCPIDADQDGVISAACPQGKDCADDDPNAHPGQTQWFTSPVKGKMGFDYDCSGKEEAQYPDVLTCTGALDCDANTQKWLGAAPPACGQMADYGVCMVVALGCQKKSMGQRVQGCH